MTVGGLVEWALLDGAPAQMQIDLADGDVGTAAIPPDRCRERGEGGNGRLWVCTRPKEHEGMHAAWGMTLAATWPKVDRG